MNQEDIELIAILLGATFIISTLVMAIMPEDKKKED